MRVGVWFYGWATVVTGILDIVWGKFEASHQPVQSFAPHLPGQQLLAYIAGVWLVAAGMAILWRRTARIGAAGSAMIYLIFGLLWLPRLYTTTHVFGFRIGVLIFVLGGVAAQWLLAAPAVLIYATNGSPDPVWRARAATAAGWLLGVPPIAFGLVRAPDQSPRLRTLRPALGAVRNFLDSVHRHRFSACRLCNRFGNSRRPGRQAPRADALSV